MPHSQPKYHTTLACYFSSLRLFFDDDLQKNPNIRKCVEQPFQQTKAQLWDEVTDTLCDLEFIQAKCTAKMGYNLLIDFKHVLSVLPEARFVYEKDKNRQETLNKYALDLVALANGKIQELKIPHSIEPWSNQLIDSEIERKKTIASRFDKLNDFYYFLGHEVINLQIYASFFPNFAFQQAWNYAFDGPVAKAAEKGLSKLPHRLLLRKMDNRPLWNPSNQILRILGNHSYGADSISVTPDWKLAIIGSRNGQRFYFWDLELGKLINMWFIKGKLKDLCISADGKRAITCSDECNVWDLETGKLLRTLNDNSSMKIQHYLSPRKIKLFRILIRKPKVTKENISSILNVKITPDGKRAVTGTEDQLCILWDLERGNVIKTLTCHSKPVSVCLTADGKRALTGSEDQTCILWDLESGNIIKTLTGPSKYNSDVCITPDGKLALTRSRNIIMLWDLGNGNLLKELRVFNEVSSISITPDGKLALTGSSDGSCSLIDLQSGHILKTLWGHSGKVRAVSLCPNGTKALTGSDDESCILWNLESGRTLDYKEEYNSHNSISCISLNSKWALSISSSIANDCVLWNLAIGKAIKTLKGHTSSISSMCFYPDSQKVITGAWDKKCIIWDINTGKSIKVLEGLNEAVEFIFITPNGRHALTISYESMDPGSVGSELILWDLENGLIFKKYVYKKDRIFGCCVSPDGKFALMGSIIWDLENFFPHKTLIGHRSSITAICITLDSKLAITGSLDNTIIIWNLQTGKAIRKLIGHTRCIKSIKTTPDGRQLISVQEDHKIIIWHFKTGKSLRKTHDTKIFCQGKISVSISPDSKRLIRWTSFNALILSDFENLYGGMYSIYILESDTQEFNLFKNGIFINRSYGLPIILDLSDEIFNSGPSVVNIRQIWDFELQQYLRPSADCPLCGHRFAPPASVLTVIEEITKKAGLKPGQSPCLELSDEAWEDPGLLGNCPKCEEALKFNPFIAGK